MLIINITIKIKDILTPRSVVYAIEKNTLLKDIVEDKRTFKFSRVPVYERSIDNIVGIVLNQTILAERIKKNKNLTLLM